MALQPNVENGISRLLGDNTAETINLSVGELTNFAGGAFLLGGNDTVQGSTDSEFIGGNNGEDSLLGGAGNDTLMGGKDGDYVDGEIGNDLVRGDLDADIVRGGEGNDSLYGGRGNDQLFGDAGDDFLSGDRDTDTLTGGAGKDTFALATGGGVDIINDFENGVDLIQLPSGVNSVSLQSSGANTLIADSITGEIFAQINNVLPSSITSGSFVGGSSTQGGNNTAPENPDFINRVVELTNLERSKLGLPALKANPVLTTAAQNHTRNMADQDFFSHTGKDGSSPTNRVQSIGYPGVAGENIAAGSATPEDVFAQWMNSSGHRANILNADYQEIGVGYYFLANDTGSVNYNRYWTQVFGIPTGR
ncbi:MAG TPA: CAP domain-containing protein [Kamptonema sp.]|nr:CAP domain-containing protein [Kamptonema sp.]